MESYWFLLLIFSALVLVYWAFSLRHFIGSKLAVLAGFCRFVWLLPVVLTLFPKSSYKELPRSTFSESIAVFVDDSQSMKNLSWKNTSKVEKATPLIANLKLYCKEIGCKLNVHNLSDSHALTNEGYTPLSLVLGEWLNKNKHSSKIVLTDGMDFQSNKSWSDSFVNNNLNASKKPSLVLGFLDEEEDNIWISKFIVPPFSFTSKQVQADVLIKRKQKELKEKVVQVQIISEDLVLESKNVYFSEGEKEVWTTITLASMPKGKSILKAYVLPSPDESILWDNSLKASLEVVNNTLGVLHLLGRPSWDGRFMRRYLKSEPKYDLISFYILRDPWDEQVANERELSLIPFPVRKLFQEELINFRVIILQNFNLFRFLLPQYQRSLVDFVKNGGGLLFVGGERALLNHDLSKSPLNELIPFSFESSSYNPNLMWKKNENRAKQGFWFDREALFSVELATPDERSRSMANIFDAWSFYSDIWPRFNNAKGLHVADKIVLKKNVTPLLNAVKVNGEKTPLGLASYPGKGRALWMFSDQLWKLAIKPDKQVARSTYNRFLESAFFWLTRNDFRRPLSTSRFQMKSLSENKSEWSLWAHGEAVRYLKLKQHWQLSVCNTSIDMNSVSIEQLGSVHVRLFGNVDIKFLEQESCRVNLSGVHPAFGSVKEEFVSFVSPIIKDSELGFSSEKITSLASYLKADLIHYASVEETTESLINWLQRTSDSEDLIIPKRFSKEIDHYWIFSKWWFWLLLSFMPLEVLVRRWNKLKPEF